MTRPQDLRWPWYQQVVDVIVLVLGIGIAVTMTIRDSWNILAVSLVLVCIGRLSARGVFQVLAGRWLGNGNGK